VFHPKLVIAKFSDKLRVAITSSNLCIMDWTMLGQVIWF